MKYISFVYKISAVILLQSVSLSGGDVKIYPLTKNEEETKKKNDISLLEVGKMLTLGSDSTWDSLCKTARAAREARTLPGVIPPAYLPGRSGDMKIYPSPYLPEQASLPRLEKEEKKKDGVNYMEILQMFTPSSDPKVLSVSKSARGVFLFHVINWGIITPLYHTINVYPSIYLKSHKEILKLKSPQLPSEQQQRGIRKHLVAAGPDVVITHHNLEDLVSYNSHKLAIDTTEEFKKNKDFRQGPECAIL